MTADLKTTAQIFKALSDPTRLRILSLLQTDALCVMDIVTVLSLPQPAVSRHLAYLQNTSLVTGQKKGLWRFYSLNPQSPVSQPLQSFLQANYRSLSGLKQDRKKAEVSDISVVIE